MQLLILVLNKVNLLNELLRSLSEEGIHGATVLESMGMSKALNGKHSEHIPVFGTLKMLLHENRPFNKTILLALNEKQLEKAIPCVKKVLGDLSQPDAGIMFTVPINYVEGYTE